MMLTTRARSAIMLLTLAALPAITACSQGSSGAAGAPKGGAPTGDQVVSLKLSLQPALGGSSVDLSKFDGKIRVVDFWATWCPPCRAAIPWLNDLHQRYHDQGVEIIGISVDENAKALAGFDKEVHIEYTSLQSSQEVEKAFGGIVGLPTTFVLDRTGKVINSYVGEMEKRELEEDLHSLLGIK
ncbi:MAG TPA: TlpA disulfide reductase family protein [Candidatus Polarisedimenticolia bacterium]|nr:TlpA disulfide reductase family protein [Candidatus Polarisedimenticolia bacterium]